MFFNTCNGHICSAVCCKIGQRSKINDNYYWHHNNRYNYISRSSLFTITFQADHYLLNPICYQDNVSSHTLKPHRHSLLHVASSHLVQSKHRLSDYIILTIALGLSFIASAWLIFCERMGKSHSSAWTS